MACAFKPCPLETNSNDGFKQEHVESCSSTTKKTFSTTIVPMATKLGKVVTYREGLPSIKSPAFKSRGLARSCDKLKTYLHNQSAYGNQT